MPEMRRPLPEKNPRMRKPNGAGSAVHATLTVALLGLVAYDTYVTTQLRAEVSALRASSPLSRKTPPAEIVGLPSGEAMLSEASRHAARAEQWLGMNRYEKARGEMTAAVRAIQKANGDARAETDTLLAQLRGAARRLSVRGSATTPGTPSAGSRQ